jgi:hypothetical protein
VRTVAETPVFVRYADEIWSSNERQQFISWIVVNLPAEFLSKFRREVEDAY